MKCIIQIPCFNEETALPATLHDLPRSLPGFDCVEVLVVDDGSTDRTAEIARQHGVEHIIRLPGHQGLARAFSAALEASLAAGADVIVHTDADNQYVAGDIEHLIQPLVAKEADIVVGERPIELIRHFSPLKKCLQRLGSWVVRRISRTGVADATSGFRAYTREAAKTLNVYNSYTYTLETLIQAGQNGLRVLSVPIRVNPPTRPSRLISSQSTYVVLSIITMIRIFVVYKPFAFLITAGAVPFGIGTLIGLRFLYFFLRDGGAAGHVQSLILAAVFLIIGFNLFTLAFVADLISSNRKLLEDLKQKSR